MSRLAGSWRLARALFELCFRPAPWHASLVVCSELGVSSLAVLSTYGTKVIVDAAVRSDRPEVLLGAAMIAGAAGMALLLSRVYANLAAALIDRGGLHIDALLMGLSTSIPTLEHHEHPRYTDTMTLVRQDRRALAEIANTAVLNLRVVATLVGAVLVLARLDPHLVALPLFGLPALIAHRAANRLVQRSREANAHIVRRRNHLYQVALSPAAARELRIFGWTEELIARHRAYSESMTTALTRSSLGGAVLTTLGALVFAAGYVGAVALVVAGAVNGSATTGSVVMAIGLAAVVNAQLAQAARQSGYLQQMIAAARRLRWLQDYGAAAAGRRAQTRRVPARLDTGIRLSAVSFAYPEIERLVLDQVDVTLPGGAVVALVGENGSGKTTLVKLLTGLYRPTSGTILVDGVPLDRFDLQEWRSRVSTTFQDFCQFEFLIRESVGVGDLSRLTDTGAVRSSLAQANGDELVRIAPDGLEAQLGSVWGGVDLSGGQWQKLALARALIRPDPLLTILDEPTASLDAVAEHALFERLRETARASTSNGRITLFVSHRFSTVRAADLIIVLGGGRVLEVGDHPQLVRSGGLYAELYELQSRGYR